MILDPLPESVREALNAGKLPADPLRRVAELRRRMGPREAAQVAEQIELAGLAGQVFPGLEQGAFTRAGLQQASHPAVAAERAQRLRRVLGDATVLDGTCGLGADAFALARAGLRVLLADASPERARLAAWNTRDEPGCLGTVVADARNPAGRGLDAVLLDPDRRPGGRRTRDPEEWSPTLREAVEVAGRFRAGCIKLAPGLDVEAIRLPPPSALTTRWQWLSHAGELKETVLWTGLAGEPSDDAGGTPREALALGRDGSRCVLVGSASDAREETALDPDEAAEVHWISEPDAAVIRAGLVGRLARRVGARPLGPGMAYLGSGAPPPADAELSSDGSARLVRSWRVLASEALDRRRVRRMLAAHGVGPLTVKKRGHPSSAEQLARDLRGAGERHGLLLVSRLARGHRAYLLEPTSDREP